MKLPRAMWLVCARATTQGGVFAYEMDNPDGMLTPTSGFSQGALGKIGQQGAGFYLDETNMECHLPI